MELAEERYEINGRKILLRSAKAEDAPMLIDYLKTVAGETRFLAKDADEIALTIAQEEQFIEQCNTAEDALMILAYVDGQYAGNCSFESKAGSRRTRHRAEIGIALYQQHTGFGLGRLMLNRLLEESKKHGFEQVELTVVADNPRAYHLYESLGFRACGRIPKANKYDDGRYADTIFMVLPLR